MIKDIKELNFPAYATLETATASIADMGDRTITTQVKIDGNIVPDFSYDWEVEFQGERYIHPIRTPQGTKDNNSLKATIDLTFRHWAIHEMKREMFADMATIEAGTAIPNKYIADINLNLGNFVTNFNLVLNYYFGGKIVMKLNPEWQYSEEAVYVNLSNAYIWDILQKMYEIYGIRWTLKTNAEGVCEILLGYPAEEVSHIFEYGFEGGLLSVQRQVQNTEIRNRLLGRGGNKNLPYRYFKDKDPNNPLFEADPDWIPELANIAFTELRGKTFRDYVRGWKAKRYGGTPMSEPTEAYLIGYNAEKFDPIEYVEDKESIEKYGVLLGALENNEGIYPSIQGAPGDVDMIVDAEQVVDDDVDASVENDSVISNIQDTNVSTNAEANETAYLSTFYNPYFTVPEGKIGNIEFAVSVSGVNVFNESTAPIKESHTVLITDSATGERVFVLDNVSSVVNIPAGSYRFGVTANVNSNYDERSKITLSVHSIKLYCSTPNKTEGWSQTFDIWVRNIWGSSRNSGETDKQYADRVWAPILGDRAGEEARVVFSSGWLSFSSDWEFPIVGYAFDDSKEGSHWRLTLAKSEAELEASGKYIPYEGYNASAGDRFFFIGIDMPHQYILWSEERIDDYKRDMLLDTSEIKPTWVVKTDKVRLNQDRNGELLVNKLSAGSQIRLTSKQFISGAYETLYLQSLTYSWTADTILYPNIEVVLSDKVAAVKNPVALIQSNVESLQKQVGGLSDIQQIIRQVCDKLYLRKDGVEDQSKSPTRFLGKVTGEKFRQGQIGGRDWGIYRDENGNAIFEADKFVARQGILVSDLVVNEVTYVGGIQINSAAAMKVTEVDDGDAGYVCYFDQQQGSVANKFKADDIALCQRFDADDNEIKFYKSRVIAVSENSVTLSKTEINGTGIPAVDDEIIHYGNYTDKTRQFIIIRDVIGGGYERMLMGLDSVTSEGIEYYFAGKSADSQARWFVGDAEQYAKYENGQFSIKGNIFVTGSDKTINEQIADLDFIREAFGEDAQGLILGTAIIVGYNNNEGNFVPMAGMSGIFDKDQENGGPAAWYGGTIENAKSMIFMNGTGYFADGLFKWDLDNGINLGNDAIKINYDGSVDFGEQIRIGASGEETLGSLLTVVAKLSDIWKLSEDGSQIVTDKQVIIKNNLIVSGDTSSGGKGENTPISGIHGIRVNGTLYEDDNADGIIDLGIISGGDVDVDLTDYYTKQEIDDKYITSQNAERTYQKIITTDNKLSANYVSGLGALALVNPSTTTGQFLRTNSNGVEWVTINKSTVGLGNVENKSSATIRGEITATNVTTALGYTPYNSANFIKANIKSTLGISDWALATSKPSYTKSEVGLGNVDNTKDSDKNVNSANQWNYTFVTGNLDNALNVHGYFNGYNNNISNYPFDCKAGHIASFGGVRTLQLVGGYTESLGLYYRKNEDIGWSSWKEIMTIDENGNYCVTKTKNLSGIEKLTIQQLTISSGGASIKGDVTIDGNLIVKGDTSSGGTGQDTPGGVTEEDVEQYLTNYVNDITTTGSGNVISSVSKSGKSITFTKGVTALTSHQYIYALTIKNSAGTTQVTYTPNSAAQSLTLTQAMVGLGNVENTALSTWVGTNKITTLGTITSGTWNGTKIANAYLANNAITIAGTSVSLGGSIAASTITAAQIGSGNSFYHSGNANLTSVAWKCSSLTMSGALTGTTTGTFSSKLTANTLVLSNTEGKAHLTFSRGGINYIHANQSGGGVAFVVNGSGITLANAQLIISSDNYVYCGTEGLAQLGLGGKRWKSVYSIDGSFSGDLTAGTFSTSSAVACGGRLRITADNSANNFGFLKSTLTTASNYGLMHIGTNEGGTSIITNAAYDKVAMSISRSVVGIGRQYSYDELKGYNDSNTRLYVDGNLVVTGDAASGSDIRFKDIIEHKTLKIEDIANAPCFSFKWNNKEDDSIHLGTSAQYWESIAPELVSGSDFKTLNYASGAMGGIISIARQMLKDERTLTEHERRINTLENENKNLKEEIRRIKDGICN